MSHVCRRRIGVLTNRFALGAGSCAKHTSLAASLTGLAYVADVARDGKERA